MGVSDEVLFCRQYEDQNYWDTHLFATNGSAYFMFRRNYSNLCVILHLRAWPEHNAWLSAEEHTP